MCMCVACMYVSTVFRCVYAGVCTSAHVCLHSCVWYQRLTLGLSALYAEAGSFAGSGARHSASVINRGDVLCLPPEY